MIGFNFPKYPIEQDYKIFPEELENNSSVYFHGTSERIFQFIKKDGFRIVEGAPSLSFSRESSLALRYACEKRDETSPNGIVIAVEYSTNLPFIKQEYFGIHVYSTDVQPLIIGYCIVPANYNHS